MFLEPQAYISLAAQETVLWPLKFEVLRIVQQLVTYFTPLMKPHMAAVMANCWRLCTSCLPLFQHALVAGECEEDEVQVGAWGRVFQSQYCV